MTYDHALSMPSVDSDPIENQNLDSSLKPGGKELEGSDKAAPPNAPPSSAAISSTSRRLTTAREAAERRIEEHRKGPIPRIPLGIPPLDAALEGGIPLKSFCVMAALSSHGKTAFAYQCAHHVAGTLKTPTLFVSLEMTNDELGDRSLSSASEVPRREWTPEIDTLHQDFESYFANTADCYLDDRARSLDEITKVLRDNFNKGVKIAFIDYCQLIGGHTGPKIYEAMNEAAITFKQLAQEYDAIVVGLAQLNKQVARRKDLTPMLHEVDYGTKFAQSADQVLFLIHPYRLNSSIDSNEYVVLVEKNRNGPSKLLVRCNFDPYRQKFTAEDPPLESPIDDVALPGAPSGPPGPPQPDQESMGGVADFAGDMI